MDSRFSRPVVWSFELFFRPWMRLRLRDPHITGLPRDLPHDVPLLVVANHVSWWDGFLIREVHRVLRSDASAFCVIAEEELDRYSILRLLGAVPLRRGSGRSVLHAFRFLRRHCLDHPDTVIAFFPQSRMWPSFKRPLGFERGISTLARMLAPVLVLPVGIHLEPLNAASPTVFLSAGEPMLVRDRPASHLRMEGAVEAELDRILAFVARHGDEATRRWPGRYGVLPLLEHDRTALAGEGSPRLELIEGEAIPRLRQSR